MVDKYSIVGAAFVLLIIGLLGVIIFSIIIFRKFHTLVKLKSLLKMLFAGLIIAILLHFIKNYIDIEKLWLFPIYLVLLSIYLIILLILREIGKEEITLVKSFFQRSN